MENILEQAEKALVDNKFRKASNLYKMALVEYPQDPVIHQGLSKCYFYLKEYEEAKVEAKTALEIQPSLALPHLILSILFEREHKYAEAEDEAETVIRLDPKMVKGYINLAALLTRHDRVKEGMALYRKAMELSLMDWEPHFRLGLILFSQGNLPECLIESRKAFSLHPSARTGSLLFLLYLRKFKVLIFFVVLLLSIIGLTAPINIAFPVLTVMVFFTLVVTLASQAIGKRNMIWLFALIILISYYIFSLMSIP